MRRSRLVITLALVFVLVTFVGAIYDMVVGRELSFADFLGVSVSLLFLALGLLAGQAELASQQQELERRVRSSEDAGLRSPSSESGDASGES